jgi:predicted nucleic acid-binding Zn ribbon protein
MDRAHDAGVNPYPIRWIPPKGPPRPSARQRVLASWRGMDLTPVESERKDTFHSVADSMKAITKKLRLPQRLSEVEIVRVWNQLLDPNVTRHAQPVGLRNGTLFVHVDTSVWLSEIVRYRRKEILERLQTSFGRDLISKLSFRLG